MNYKLINRVTGQETICTKVVVDGFEYYVSDTVIKDVIPFYGRWQIEKGNILNQFPTYLTDLSECKLVIATNNPSIDVPKVVDEVLNFADDIHQKMDYDKGRWYGRIEGYNKSQETHPYSEEDVLDFAIWLNDTDKSFQQSKHIDFTKPDIDVAKQLLEIWKEQKTKTIYYE
jgi:hypothetical protein